MPSSKSQPSEEFIELESDGGTDIDTLKDGTVVVKDHEKPMKQQSRAIQARWAGEEATEDGLRKHFEELPLEKALALLARMRKHCEIAGGILNQRINEPLIQRCEVCKHTLEEISKAGKPIRGWRLDMPRRDEQDPRIIHVLHFCSDNCISLYNNKTQGVRGLSDRGMLGSDNPKNHPRD